MDPAAEASQLANPARPRARPRTRPTRRSWIANPKPHDATPEPGSPQSFRALLVAIGKVLDQPALPSECAALFTAVDNLFSPADLERRKELTP